MDRDVLKNELLKARLKREHAEADLVALKIAEEKRLHREQSASLNDNREYRFIGSVSDNTVETAAKWLKLWARRDPGSLITITLNSPGGGVFAGLALYDLIQDIKRQGVEVNIIAQGMAASMGGILLQAGTKRVIGANAYMLIHEISSGAIGKVSEMEDEAAFAKRLQDRLVTILAERSTLTKQQIKRRWKRKDWWLDADEALELGFADEIA